MSTVICFAGNRKFYRDVFVDPNELSCITNVPEKPREVRIPSGRYDVAAFLKLVPPPWNEPRLLVVQLDGFRQIVPFNLGAVRCPKVLLIGALHHMDAPIRHAIEYARGEAFDCIIVENSRQHVHFFHEAGLPQTSWLPSFSLSPHEHAPARLRPRGAIFMGQTHTHPFRMSVLGRVVELGGQFEVGEGSRSFAAEAYSQAKVSLNVSLNGDLNQRIFEVLAAGGFLLTDRLSPEAGMASLFEDGKHLRVYSSPEELRGLIDYYQNHEDEAFAIASAGHAAYLERHRPEHKIADLLDAVKGNVRAEYRGEMDRRTALPATTPEVLKDRIESYQILQEFQRSNPQVNALFWSGLEREACDAIDLYRVFVSVMRDPGGGDRTVLHEAGLDGRVRWVDADLGSVAPLSWNIVVCRIEDLASEAFKRLVVQRGAQLLLIARSAGVDPAELDRAVAPFMESKLPSGVPVYALRDGRGMR